MFRPNLATYVRNNPSAAPAAFERMDSALNRVLPGSAYHERYVDAGEVGFAAVIGSVGSYLYYNPVVPRYLNGIAFMADNQAAHPGAWEPKPEDSELLGGMPRKGMGRYTAFALAKVAALAETNTPRNYDPLSKNLGPGKVGIAGGRYLKGALVGVSGLWEVHDDIAAKFFVEEIPRTRTDNETIDYLAADLDYVFEALANVHRPRAATELDRREYLHLMFAADGIIEHLQAQKARSLD